MAGKGTGLVCALHAREVTIESAGSSRLFRWCCPGMLILTGLALTAGVWGDFQLYGHSETIDYFRQISFDRCIRAGILFPRWLPDTYFGYGSPLFHFYGPLPYYITEIFLLLGISVAASFKASMVLMLILSGLGMYLFSRDFAGPLVSFVAGLAYMFAPYHLVDMIVRHAIGEHMAFTFIPFAAWGLTGMLQGKKFIRLPVGALALTGLILTHNVSAMLALAALMLWWIILAIRTSDRKAIVWGGALLLGGMAAGLFFWGPVMAEKNLTYARPALTSGYFVYSDHFVYPQQLVRPFWGFGGSRKGTSEDNMSYQIGIPHLLFLAASLGFFVVGFSRSRHTALPVIYGLLLFFGSVFMTLSASGFVYRALPLLKYVQFPWRFLLFVAFASSILALAIEPLAQALKKPVLLPVLSALAGILLVVFYAGYARPAANLYSIEEDKFGFSRMETLKKKLASGKYMHIWEMNELQYFRQKGETGTSRDDYLPRTVDRGHKPDRIPAQEVAWVDGGATGILWQNAGPVDLTAEVEAGQGGVLEFARFFFPGWKGYVNGRPARLHHEDKKGTILVSVPGGRSRVEIRFESTPFRMACGLVSLLTLIGILFYCGWAWLWQKAAHAS